MQINIVWLQALQVTYQSDGPWSCNLKNLYRFKANRT